MSTQEIVDNPALRRFELVEDGHTAFLIYERLGDSIRLVHTEVPSALRGKGVGSKLVAATLRWAEQNNLRVIPLCPFVIEYLKAHTEHLQIVDEKYRNVVRES